MGLKVGVTFGFTNIDITAVVAQTLPADGVKVYWVVIAALVAILFTAGNQVPVKPLFDIVGRVIVAPLQNGPKAVNVGV